jgi:hypothetical protein
MKRVISLVVVTIVACACPSKATKTGGGSGSGSGSGSGVAELQPTTGGCDGAKPKIEAMYRAEAQAKEPKRVDEAVADNTAMVMAECAKAPARVSACIAGAATLKDLETTCLPQLDDEGSEGDTLKH